MKRFVCSLPLLLLTITACAPSGGVDVDVVVAFATSSDPYVQEQWTAFRDEFIATARVIVAGGDFPAVYKEFTVPAEFPGLYDVGTTDAGSGGGDAAVVHDAGAVSDAGARVDAGLPAPLAGGEGRTVVKVTVQVPRGTGRSFGVEFVGKGGATTFAAKAAGVTVGDGMKPVELAMRPHVSIKGDAKVAKDILRSRYEAMQVGTVESFVFDAEPAPGEKGKGYAMTATGSAEVGDDGTYGAILTPYNADDFIVDGVTVSDASVFLRASSENGYTGFCVPGTAEGPGTGLEPGQQLDATLYVAPRDNIGASDTALLSCVSPQTLDPGADLYRIPRLYLSFVSKTEPTYVSAIVRGPDQFETTYDDRPELGGQLMKPKLDVGLDKDIESGLYLGRRSLMPYQLQQFAGQTLRVHLEIGFGSGASFYTSNEVEFKVAKPGSDGGTPDGGADGGAVIPDGDAGVKI